MPHKDERRVEPLEQSTSHVLEEGRMVTPGLQALFGFQLSVVFQQAFDTKLSPAEQWVHLFAICFVALSIALIMTPAAYHRQAEPRTVSTKVVRVASRLVALALLPFSLAICAEVYLIARVITNDMTVTILATAVMFLLFLTLWFVWPRVAYYLRHRQGVLPAKP